LSSITATWGWSAEVLENSKECPDPDNSIEIVAGGYDFMSALFAFLPKRFEIIKLLAFHRCFGNISEISHRKG